jgi:O-antigen/teichoic acid export membrane protein
LQPTATHTSEGRVARSFAALASGDAIARVIGFAAGVYVARRLGAEMFGVMMFGQAVVLYFTHLAACGTDLPGVRDIAEEPGRARTLAPSILTVRLIVSLGLIVVLASSALTFLPRLDGIVVALYSLTLLGHGPNPRFILLGQSRPVPVAIARTVGELAYLGGVLALVHAGDDVARVPAAQALGDVLAVALMFVALARSGVRWRLELDWPAVKPLFARAFPLVVNILLGLMIYNSDLIVLRFFKGATTVGWYSASYQLISFLINMAWAYSYSLLPALTQASKESGARRALYHTSIAQSFAVTLPIAVGGAMLSSTIIAVVFGAKFEPAGLPLAILIGSIPCMLYKDVAMVSMIVSGREGAVMRMTAVGVVFNLALNFALIPRFGMAGAAVSTLATEVLRFALAAWYVRRDGFDLVPAKRLAKSLAAAGAMAAALVFIAPQSLPIEGAVGPELYALAVLVTDVAIGAAAYAGMLSALGAIRFKRGGLPALSV